MEIYKEDMDYEVFKILLKKALLRYGGKLHAYCLMKNHYHLLLETEQEEAWKIMKMLSQQYAMYYNRKNNYKGHVNNGECIISGMAKGVDAYAHTACMEAGGYTIAVLACGLDICYPSEHRLLMERISEKGLLLSEYAPGVPPVQYNFPRRNRIISAWSDRLTVIAPGKGSGVFITADESRNLGREVIVYRTS